jgi:hypothetical protein
VNQHSLLLLDEWALDGWIQQRLHSGASGLALGRRMHLPYEGVDVVFAMSVYFTLAEGQDTLAPACWGLTCTGRRREQWLWGGSSALFACLDDRHTLNMSQSGQEPRRVPFKD